MKDKSENNALIRNCTFKFECDMEWDLLEESHEGAFDKVRFCGRCSKSVFLTETDDELRENVRLDRCVVINSPVKRLRLTMESPVNQAMMIDGELPQNKRIMGGIDYEIFGELDEKENRKNQLWKNVWTVGLFVAVVALLVRVIF